MSYAVTPVYGINKPTGMTTALELPDVLGQMADTLEAALVRGGMATPDVANLADLTAKVAKLPKGRVGSRASSTAGPLGFTAETTFDPVTFTAEASRRYRVSWDGVWVVNTALITANFRFRWAAGAAVTAAGTMAHIRPVRSWAFGEYLDMAFSAELVGLPAGTVTVAPSAERLLGTGTLDIRGAVDVQRRTLVEDLGAV